MTRRRLHRFGCMDATLGHVTQLVWWDTSGSVHGEVKPPSAEPLPR